ncbi:alpha-1-antitrypsin homolog [Thalassophryne amazonica]|uniref:alpha-1-antitrypsin homolog n=1 Tax=Thalassophryne amazonica TaxID=390379 RepID=UPI0014709D09|nr:alpha-1-antitrypsin homolog [Thalassophryne amazonica]XP_034018504.1 alpha-1-antitrypsin homolog [Thalassophryne amazonica]
MRCLSASCALTVVLLAMAWADAHHHIGHDHHGHPPGHDHDDHQHYKDHHGHEVHPCHILAPPNGKFAFDLYKNLLGKSPAGSNIFFSPLGVATALSMLSTGAHGATHSQMFTTLGYNEFNQTQINEAYQHLLKLLGEPNEYQLEFGNGIALRNDFSTLETFVNDVKTYYQGEFFHVDFSKPTDAAAKINSFIANKTHDMIKDQVKDLDNAMAMVLISYIYFSGQWEKPFNASFTHKDTFHVSSSKTVQVDMMKRTGRYKYYNDKEHHHQAILLPYKGGNSSMIVVLPDEGKMDEVEGILDLGHFRHWLKKLKQRLHSVTLELPKFSISDEASLKETLQELGIKDAFEDNADFSGISDKVPTKVSKATHKAVMSVDEVGTTAAAATTLEMMPMSMPIHMVVNRPFLVFIMEKASKSILFMGKVSDPTAA